MSAYKIINCLISQTKHILWVFKRTKVLVKSDVLENIYDFTLKNCVYLDYDLYSM